MYLEQDRDAAESSAFEARYRTAPQRMRALAWCGPESLASSPFAREQLSAVRAACSDAMGRPVDWDMRPPGQRVERGGASSAASSQGPDAWWCSSCSSRSG
ncbi:DUF6584 family protein [Streptomyces sp. NPDC008222]|uniref:DUF6584 family protein n=1 Tax=Streptomyces sp. NPDC008222 TaxID=3364820 RepID=UPI0036E55B6E